ncbi:serine O-acetyltransferase [Candidatus Termititenax persephonae]|uniref:Serine acetyltransferase n=1 Tax=Candidatus Termititenax persephonae TaxID=2218525 RepID=A0A388THS8_9BACT|nr:serine O-acetyltransferase [Candidatus Termititenax persephonae]
MLFIDEIKSALKYDPACRWWEVWLYHGLWVVWIHKFLHVLYVCRVPIIPRLISQLTRFLTGIEIHPGAKIGRGVFIDHGSGVVIGETAEVGDNCLIYHGVTLGGTSTKRVKRHPTVGANTIIGCGAKIIGKVRIGSNCKIGANTTILKDVPDNSTVVGMPGRVIIQNDERVDNDWGKMPDPVEDTVVHLIRRIVKLEEELQRIEHK